MDWIFGVARTASGQPRSCYCRNGSRNCAAALCSVFTLRLPLAARRCAGIKRFTIHFIDHSTALQDRGRPAGVIVTNLTPCVRGTAVAVKPLLTLTDVVTLPDQPDIHHSRLAHRGSETKLCTGSAHVTCHHKQPVRNEREATRTGRWLVSLRATSPRLKNTAATAPPVSGPAITSTLSD